MRELRKALKAGLVAYATCLLAVALFGSPIAAAHADFGHTHPQSAVNHTHSVTSLLAATPGFVFTLISTFQIITLAITFVLAYYYFGVSAAHQSRAPPVTV